MCMYWYLIWAYVFLEQEANNPMHVYRMQRRVLHQFVMMAKRQMPRGGDRTDGSLEDKAAQDGM